MKRIQYHRYGGPETMRLEDFALDEPRSGQVAVKVEFAAINPIDWKLRNGLMKIITGNAFPRAMGMDFSGTVISVGSGVTRLRPGDAVFGMARLKQGGAFGNAVVTNEAFVARKPDEVSFQNAACLATPGVTAWNGLVDKARLEPGQHVFVISDNRPLEARRALRRRLRHRRHNAHVGGLGTAAREGCASRS